MAPALVLEALGLTRLPDAQGGGLVFAATGGVRDGGATTTAALKLGRGATIPDALKARFPAAADPPAEESALWLAVPGESPAGDEAAWLAILEAESAQLHGSVPLGASELDAGGLLAFGPDTRLDVALELSGATVEHARLSVSGSAALTGALGPIAPAALQVGAFALAIELDTPPPAAGAIEDPTRLLDTGFHGELTLAATTSALTLGAVMLAGGTADVRLAVRSPAGSRRLEVERVAFESRSTAPLTLLGGAGHLAGLGIAQVVLQGDVEGPAWRRVRVTGSGAVTLPDALDGVLAGPGGALVAQLTLEHDGGETLLALDLADARLAPAAARFAAEQAPLGLRLRSSGGVWRFALETAVLLSWSELAARLAPIARVPDLGPLPSVRATTRAEIAQDSTAALRAELALVGPDGGEHDGPLGLLPVTVRGMRLTLAAAIAGPDLDWALAGAGELSTAGWLRSLAAVDRLAFACSVADGDGGPRVRLEVGDGLPPLALPSFGPDPVELFALERLVVELADELRISGDVAFARPQPSRLAAELGLPDELRPLLEALAGALPDAGSFSVRAPLGAGGEQAALEIALRSSDPPAFKLLEQLGALANPSGAPLTGVTALDAISVPDDFFAVAPHELRLSATLADEPALRLSAALACVVLGESFDLTLGLALVGGEPELSLLAGTSDPIRVTVPAPDPARALGAADVGAIAAAYGLGATQRQALEDLEAFFAELAGDPGTQGVLAFEVSDFGLRMSLQEGPTVSGDVRLVQLPRVLEPLMALAQLELGLGATADKLFVDIAWAGGGEPLVTVPVPGGVDVDVFFGRFRLAYAWGRNELGFELQASLVPSRTITVGAGGSGVLVGSIDAEMHVGATLTAPPAPIPEGRLVFGPPAPGRPPSAIDELGLEVVVGAGQTRLVTAYVRELAFSPTAFLLWPGVRADAGLVLGGPNPKDLPDAAAYLDVPSWDRGAFFARFTVTRGTLIFLDPMQGALLNPLAMIPPFVTANPPYWIAPPSVMGDVYADEIGVSLNLPRLAFFDLVFERPLPSFSLQALLELAALAASGFSAPIPAGSPLRKLLFARLSVAASLDVPGLSRAQSTLAAELEVNVADFVNGAIDVMQKAQATLDGEGDLLQEVADDPAALVRMVPQHLRRFEHAIELGGLRFSGSVYLLTPDELADELMLFFENKRRRPRGIAANAPPPAAPGGPATNQAPTLLDSVRIDGRHLLDHRAGLPDVAALTARGAQLALGRQAARQRQIDGLSRDRDDRLAATADQAAEALVAARTATERAQVLKALEVSEAARAVEDALAGTPPGRGGPTSLTPAPSARDRVRAVVLAALRARDRAMAADGALRAPPERLAADLVAGALGAPDRAREVDRLLPAERRGEARGGVLAALEDFDRGRGDRARLQDAIAATLSETYAVRRGSLADMAGPAATPAAVGRLLGGKAAQTWAGVAVHTDRVDVVRTFDAARIGGLAGRLGERPPAPPPPPPAGMVEQVAGYEIRRRDGQSGFSVALGAPGASYKVQMRGGRYWLLVRAPDNGAGRLGARPPALPDGGWNAHELPQALVAAVPEGLDKARRLRDLLVVAPRVVRRPPTTAERAATAEQLEHGPALYKASILARPEYEIKPSGGVHGPFYLGDLLRNPSSGAYTVPAGPALVGGFKAQLFDDEIGFAGMLVASPAGPDVFLYGHHDLDMTIGRLTAATRGEFTAIAGTLWQQPGQAGDAVHFSGHVALRSAGATMLEGAATGSFRRTPQDETEATLRVAVDAQGSVDLAAGDVQFARVAYEFSGDVDVAIEAGAFSVGAAARAEVTVDIATYGIRQEVVVPAATVCVDVPVVDSIVPWQSHWESACVTTPAVTAPVPDFSTVQWQRLATHSCALSASASTTRGLTLELDLGPFGQALSSLTGTTKVALPALR